MLEMPPSLMKVPSLALRCSLDRVTPLSETWSDQCIEFFTRLFLGKAVAIVIKVSWEKIMYENDHMTSCNAGDS